MRRQARKRKEKRRSRIRIRIPRVALAKLSVVPGALLVVFLSYELSGALLDRPIRTIRIEGPFERVSALQIEAAIGDELERGFFSASLAEIHDRIVALPWIDKANVARRWPDTLEISVTEQVPAACWGERGLMNTRGELFVENARHIPAELPRLSGPDGSEAEVARRYLEIRRHLIPLGLDLRRVHLDARGAWDLTLSNGVEIRLGRRDTDVRTQLFLDVVANIVASREGDIEFVDMRYSNGFSIGWEKDAGAEPVAPRVPGGDGPEMVAERAGRALR
ncbi:MAG TPA: cell division protein FtsQ/DivIB [Woeseiaceae bacterium]|nr:cell division protein FtsQ/DivIB [Woeseiaceae bacterium]